MWSVNMFQDTGDTAPKHYVVVYKVTRLTLCRESLMHFTWRPTALNEQVV
jgi:hypothetical protein